MIERLLPWIARAAIGAAVLLDASPMVAHELPTTTATMTLRDGHLELRISVDLLAWFGQLEGDGAEGVARLVQTDPARLELLRQRAREQIARELVVRVDGVQVAIDAVRFPGARPVRAAAGRALVASALAAEADAPGLQAHAEMLPLVVEVRLRARPRSLDVRFPAAFGAVQAQLVEPRIQTTRPGGVASFVTSDQPSSKPARPTRRAGQDLAR